MTSKEVDADVMWQTIVYNKKNRDEFIASIFPFPINSTKFTTTKRRRMRRSFDCVLFLRHLYMSWRSAAAPKKSGKIDFFQNVAPALAERVILQLQDANMKILDQNAMISSVVPLYIGTKKRVQTRICDGRSTQRSNVKVVSVRNRHVTVHRYDDASNVETVRIYCSTVNYMQCREVGFASARFGFVFLVLPLPATLIKFWKKCAKQVLSEHVGKELSALLLTYV